MRIALDATYSLGENLSGVGVYAREMWQGLAASRPHSEFLLCFRPQRLARSLSLPLPANCRRRLLTDSWVPRSAALFHGLNQRLPKKCPRRAVSTFHDLFVLTGDYSTPEFRRRFADQARQAAARSELIIAVSEFTASHVETLLGIRRNVLRVIRHGVRFPRFVAPPGSREKLILHVGALQRRKNIGRLVEAFERLEQDWRLVLAGSAGYGAEQILERIHKSPCRGRIQLAGYVSDPELENLYSRASIFAFPSLDEGFGMPVLDAMARGVPVLTSNRSALPEVSGHAARLVDPESVDEIGEALAELASDETLRAGLAERGLKRAASFSWEAAVNQTWAVYEELVG